jgi:hypothetical protein
LNYLFQPINAAGVDRRLAGLPGIDHPFIVHVGSSHSRKNRDGVLRAFVAAAEQTDLRLVFEDESGMAESIVRLAADRESRAEMRQRGLENVHSRSEHRAWWMIMWRFIASL